MKTFQIEIKESLSRVIAIEAVSIDDALEIVNIKYRNEEIILNASDFCSTEISVFEDGANVKIYE